MTARTAAAASKRDAASASSPPSPNKRLKLDANGGDRQASTPRDGVPAADPTATNNDEEAEFDDADEAELVAAAEAAEQAAQLGPSAASSSLPSSSSSPPPPPSVSSSSTDTTAATTTTSTTSTTPAKPPATAPKQTLLFPSNPKRDVPALVPPTDPSADPLWLERQTMHPAWLAPLLTTLQTPSFTALHRFLAAEQASGRTIYPPAAQIHSWSRLTPPSRVKVVVVGQDPYHGPHQACGLSFSVPPGVAVPPSLRNIYKEVAAEMPAFRAPAHGCLDGWARQGVLLLNACLTVEAGRAGSHHGKGWEQVTKAVLRHVAQRAARGGPGKVAESRATIEGMFASVRRKQAADGGSGAAAEGKDGGGKEEEDGGDEEPEPPCRGVVFLVWGQPASKTLAEAGITDKSPNVLILRSAHPSPLSAHRGFLGNGHFKKANEWLEQRYGKGQGIDWTKL